MRKCLEIWHCIPQMILTVSVVIIRLLQLWEWGGNLSFQSRLWVLPPESQDYFLEATRKGSKISCLGGAVSRDLWVLSYPSC